MIKYLLKITSKKKYARDLINAKLYMNCAAFYHDMESGTNGQEDPMEAAVSSTDMLFVNSLCPIYCMMIIEDTDIQAEKIRLNKDAIKAFYETDGYIVMLPYEQFIERLSTCDTNGYKLTHGRVQYGSISLSLTKKLVDEAGIKQLFIKNEKYSIQNEHRIVIREQLNRILESKIFDGKCVQVEKGFEHKIYKIQKGLADIAKLYCFSELTYDNEFYYLPLINHELRVSGN